MGAGWEEGDWNGLMSTAVQQISLRGWLAYRWLLSSQSLIEFGHPAIELLFPLCRPTDPPPLGKKGKRRVPTPDGPDKCR